ncbi:MAG: bacterial Ig-like domain-containing protein, partial [Acholeplasmataceae bacterium]
MKNIYLMFLLVFGFMFMPKINAQTEEVTISINERLPKAYIKGSQAPDFKGHFIVRVDGTRRDLTDGELDIGGFDVNQLGTYTITATIGEVSNSLEVKVIETDTEAPIITVNKAFLDKNADGQTPWSSQETMISFMARFTIYDEVDGLIPATESMFQGIEKVKLTDYGAEYTIWFDVEDSSGNLAVYGEIKLLIVNTLSSILVEYDEDLPVEFIVNSTEPNFNDYFKVIDVEELDPSQYSIRLGGFDITQVGEYNITLFYQREYIFDSNRDIARVTKVFKVIEEDTTSPEIITYQIDDNLNELGQLVWGYMNDPKLTKEQQIQDHKTRFMERFVKVKDNVDGVIAVNESMFVGLEDVDFFKID